MALNISPEDILRQKELAGGVEYDDPQPTKETGVKQLTQEVEDLPSRDNPAIPKPQVQNEQKATPSNLGKAQSGGPAYDSGWKNLPFSLLPSKGLFYPSGARIAIRAAEVREIRHFSTIDDEDRLDIEEKLSYVLERCSRMEFPGEGVVSFKDLKQEDRFFIIMAIRDLTFVKGENSIMLRPDLPCKNSAECPFAGGIELRTGVLSSYEIDPQILKYYHPEKRTFVFDLKKINKTVEMCVPSIGVTQVISDFVISQSRLGTLPDDSFLKIAPFIFTEWRDLTDSILLAKMREMDYWTKEEYSLIFELSERIKIGTELQVKQQCQVCGAKEVTAEISFPQGLRSLFIISDIFRELL